MPSPASALKTRAKLLEAATGFLGRGETAVSIQQIATAAGVSVGALYSFFADKAELFAVAAREAALASFPEIPASFADITDPALRYLISALIACRRPEYAPELTRIIVEAGPVVFAGSPDHLEGGVAAIRASVSRGLCVCDDPEAFVIAASGAYQNALAYLFLGNGDRGIGGRVILPLGKSLGYSDGLLRSIIARVDAIPVTELS